MAGGGVCWLGLAGGGEGVVWVEAGSASVLGMGRIAWVVPVGRSLRLGWPGSPNLLRPLCLRSHAGKGVSWDPRRSCPRSHSRATLSASWRILCVCGAGELLRRRRSR